MLWGEKERVFGGQARAHSRKVASRVSRVCVCVCVCAHSQVLSTRLLLLLLFDGGRGLLSNKRDGGQRWGEREYVLSV